MIGSLVHQPDMFGSLARVTLRDAVVVPHACRRTSAVAWGGRTKWGGSPASALAEAIAIRIAAQTDVANIRGGSPTALELHIRLAQPQSV